MVSRPNLLQTENLCIGLEENPENNTVQVLGAPGHAKDVIRTYIQYHLFILSIRILESELSNPRMDCSKLAEG